ncbi:MAG: hypothetical protein CVV41_10475 [Candidatus Riflebacteria bacterium HGW-Riflebacteria-1]|nr:MAG: hypothetical protein CVV41_10475 [Candidatus Riflebacteria bacterium HGW-Riflebacteria-1]
MLSKVVIVIDLKPSSCAQSQDPEWQLKTWILRLRVATRIMTERRYDFRENQKFAGWRYFHYTE